MTTTTTDRTVADAIERVLEAERAAAAAVELTAGAAKAAIDVARDQRRQILEVARRRVARLHEGAQPRLARRLAAIEATAASDTVDAAGLRAVADAALAAVAARLTGADAPG
jgi:hypothetical protein